MQHTKTNYEFSKSLNGENIVYIARDPLGTVRFRANSMEALLKDIATYEKDQEQAIQKEMHLLKEKEEIKNTSKGKRFLENALGVEIRKKKRTEDLDL